jgi:hypothetical protein
MFAKRFADPTAWRRKLLSKWQFKVEKSDFQDGFSKFLSPKDENVRRERGNDSIWKTHTVTSLLTTEYILYCEVYATRI